MVGRLVPIALIKSNQCFYWRDGTDPPIASGFIASLIAIGFAQ
jgi:hypothetical protein